MRASTILTVVGASAFISAGGLGAAAVIAAPAAPQKTVTIDVGKGEKGDPGPPGPQGPKGDPGGTTCPDGYVFGKLIINHPGGQATIFTCITPDSN